MGDADAGSMIRQQEAIQAVRSKNWSMARSIWQTFLGCTDESLRQKAFTYVSMSSRYLCDLDIAERVAEEGLRAFPESLPIAREYAASAAAKENWDDARERWAALKERAGNNVPLPAYIGLARALRELESYDAAEKAVAEGLSVHENAFGLLRELGEIAMRRMDWGKAISVFEKIIQECPSQATEAIYIRLSIAFLRNKQSVEADYCIGKALARYPGSIKLLIRLADNALAARDWHGAIKRFNKALEFSAAKGIGRLYERLSFAHRMSGQTKQAQAVLRNGINVLPEDAALSFALAETAMAMRDWEEAAKRWANVFECDPPLGSQTGCSRYLQSTAGDWDATDWCRFAEFLGSDRALSAHYRFSVLAGGVIRILLAARCLIEARCLFGKVSHVVKLSDRVKLTYANALRGDNALEEAARVLSEVDLSKQDGELLSVYRKLIFRCCQSDNEELAKKVIADAGPLSGVLRSEIEHYRDSISQLVALGKRGGLSEHGGTAVIQFHLISCRKNTAFADLIEAGIYLTRDSVGVRVSQEIGEKMGSVDTWRAGRFMRGLARRLSLRYGDQFKKTPVLTASALADAVYHPFFTELSNIVPLRHLARKLASEANGQPVFIDLPATQCAYVNFWGRCETEALYLYVELRKRGVNAFLCRKYGSDELMDPNPSLRFVPSARFRALSTMNVDRSEKIVSRTAVAPDGIRGVNEIFASQNVHMLISSNITLNRPYSRKEPQKPLRFTDTLFEEGLLPKSERVSFTFSGALQDGGALYRSDACEIDLFAWFDRLFGEYLEIVGKRAIEFVVRNNIQKLYICDHLFTQSALLTRAMRLLRKKVILLPHSANPVHTGFRSEAEVDKVISILQSGVACWRAVLPSVDVVHDPTSMLPVPGGAAVESATHDDTGAISVVIIDSGLSMGRLPRLRISRQLETYRSFMAGVCSLGGGAKVYFRGKGGFGNEVTWLRSHDGNAMNWVICPDHPLAMNYKNMLFVTIGFGSSAILEGIARGIPGMIVREDKVEDYTLLDTAVIPTGDVGTIITEIQRCRDLTYRTELIARQVAYYCNETGYGNSGIKAQR